jgi:crotonobetainyl-CoA:carnitine CoA-transferase CaiB-like acyl-CoA transferase
MSESGLPLEGVTVVALEQAVAAPYATRQLADIGARVIKVERTGGGDFARGYDTTVNGLSSHFVWVNRSKESIALNLKAPEGQEVLHRLLANADVFIQNLAPRATERLGFGAATLRERYPRLIVCDLSGYGSDGPYRDKKAYDLLIQCEVGIPSITGTEETPSKAGISVADIAGGMAAYSAILAALFRRERTGEGAQIEVSLFDALADWMGFPMYYTAYGGTAPARTGARHAVIAPYGPFLVSDGLIFLGIQNEREWARFCSDVLRRPELVTDPRFETSANRVANRDDLHVIIDHVLSQMTGEQALTLLDAAGIANARLRTVEEFVDHPQLAARNRWREVASHAGPVKALLPGATFAGFDARMDPIPAAGEHTEAILREVGYDDTRIAALRDQGVIDA